MARALVLVAALALAPACTRNREAPPSPTATPPRDAAATPPRDAAAIAIDAGGLDARPIGRDEPAPVGAPPNARVLGGVRFTDRLGPGALYLLETEAFARSTLTISARLMRGDRTVRVVVDRADACAAGNLTGFAPPTATATDLDHDGVAELGFGYLVGCAGARVVAKQLVLVDERKFIVRGSDAAAGVPEPAAEAWPPGALALAEAAYRDNAGALDAAVTAPALADVAQYTVDSELPRVDERRTVGDADATWSYPTLPMLASAQAATVSARMRRFVAVVPRASDIGQHVARCDVGLITAEVASVTCAVTARLRPGPSALAITVWRTGDLGDVATAELGLTPRRGCTWALTADGVAWTGAACDPPVRWEALVPTTPRAQALVDRMRAP